MAYEIIQEDSDKKTRALFKEGRGREGTWVYN